MRTGDRFSPSRRPHEGRPPERPARPPYGDRPPYEGGGNRPPYEGGGNRPTFSGPRPPFAGPGPGRPTGPAVAATPDAPSTVEIREGDRVVKVTGSPAFIRQTLDDLPALFAKLTGVPVPTPAAISIPAPPARTTVTVEEAPVVEALAAYEPRPGDSRPDDLRATRTSHSARNGSRKDGTNTRGAAVKNAAVRKPASAPTGLVDSLEEEVYAVLRGSKRPLKVADIRAQLDGDVTGQQVRRILERSDRVTSNTDKPAGYRLRQG